MAKKTNNNTIEVNSNIFLKIIYPDLLYKVQNALIKAGIHFVDLNTGLIVTGKINIDTLGMITSKSFKKPKKQKGNASHFLIPQPTKKVYDVEATINIYEPSSQNDPVIFTIQIVDESDLEFWQGIFLKIGQEYLYQKPDGVIVSDVIFHLVPLTLPNPKDPQSAISAMLNNIQKYQASNRTSLDLLPGYARPSLDFYESEDNVDT